MIRMIIRIGTTINPIGCEDYVWVSGFSSSHEVEVGSLKMRRIFLDNSCLFQLIAVSSDELQNVSGTRLRGIKSHSQMANANLVLISSCYTFCKAQAHLQVASTSY